MELVWLGEIGEFVGLVSCMFVMRAKPAGNEKTS